jgi:hypothetical protein
MNIKVRLSLLAASVSLVAAIVAVVYSNVQMAYGNHIWIASGMQIPDGIDRLLKSKSISRTYLKSQGFRCEFVLIAPEKQILMGEAPLYQAVPAMFVFYDLFGRHLSKDDNDFFTYLTYEAISQCNKEALLHANAPPPLIYAIITARVDFVEKMINSNVATNFTLSRPGKASDGMTPVDYARYLMNRDGFRTYKDDYEKIVRLLDNHAKSVRAMNFTSTPAPPDPSHHD